LLNFVKATFFPPIALYSLKLVVCIVIVPDEQLHRFVGNSYHTPEAEFRLKILRFDGQDPAPVPVKSNVTVTAESNVCPCGVSLITGDRASAVGSPSAAIRSSLAALVVATSIVIEVDDPRALDGTLKAPPEVLIVPPEDVRDFEALVTVEFKD
jgi:hypothetical protein